jgi:hypothetical protein
MDGGKQHVVLGQDDIFVTDGQNVESIASDKVRREILGSISPEYYYNCRVAVMRHLEEVWFLIPSSSSVAGEIDDIWTWRYTTNAWGHRTAPPGLRFACAALRPDNWGSDAWEDDEEEWELDTTTWAESSFTPAMYVSGGVTTEGTYKEHVIQIGGAYTTVFSEDFPRSFVERTGLMMAENQRGFVSEVTLAATGSPIQVQIAAAEAAEGPYRWSSVETWTPGTTRRLPFRSPSGLFFGVRLTWADAGASAVTEVNIKYSPVGRR